MTIDRMHQEIKLRWNKLNSNHKKDFPPALLDDIINKVTDDYIEIFYSGSNNKPFYKFGFETTQSRIDMLQSFVVPEKDLATSNPSFNRYISDLSSLDPKYRHFLRGFVIPEECTSKTIPITIVRLNDLDEKLKDANTQPSLKWNRCLATFKDNLLDIRTGDYTIDGIKIEYLRFPIKVFSGDYDSLEYISGDMSAYNTLSPKVDSDVPEQYHDLLVDMAVQFISVILGDNNLYQLNTKNILDKV